jgi:shikimate dehydrogenase
MHNAAFQELAIDAEYRIFEKPAEQLEFFLHSLQNEHIFGLNVTVPFKEKVIPYMHTLTKEAQLIGAVNTIKREGECLHGFNTDAAGFIKHLTEDLFFIPEDKHISIIGAGGAARAITIALAGLRPQVISLFDLEKSKALSLCELVRKNFPDVSALSVGAIDDLFMQGTDLLVNATPNGMRESDPCLVRASAINKYMLVYDLIYTPAETKLLRLAKEQGARFANGLGMLLYQGMIAFEIWTGKEAPQEVMRNALLGALR